MKKEKRENDSAKWKRNVISLIRGKEFREDRRLLLFSLNNIFPPTLIRKERGWKHFSLAVLFWFSSLTLFSCGKQAFFSLLLACTSYFFSRISFVFIYFHSRYEKSTILELSFYFLSLPFSSEFSLFSFLFHFFLLYVHVGQVRYSPENSNAWKIRTVPLRLGT